MKEGEVQGSHRGVRDLMRTRWSRAGRDASKAQLTLEGVILLCELL